MKSINDIEQFTTATFAITPEFATTLLDRNKTNRPKRQTLINRYCGMMERNVWANNAESIKVTKSGQIIDGQHRLEAIKRYGRPVIMTIVSNIPDEAIIFDTIDSGRPRTHGDRLHGLGLKYSKMVAQALGYMFTYFSGVTTAASVMKPDTDQLLGLFKQHPKIEDCADAALQLRQIRLNTSIGLFFTYAIGVGIDPAADQFYRSLLDGENLTKHDPVYWLRSRILDNAANRAKLPQLVVLALAIKAWNAYALGKPVHSLKIGSGEPMPEIYNFPVPSQRKHVAGLHVQAII